MVTAETAVAMPALVLVLAAAVWGLSCVGAQLRCVDAAREGARLAARGESAAVVRAAAARAAPAGAAVDVAQQGEQVVVVVRATVRPFGAALSGLTAVEVDGRSAALQEPGLEP